MDFATEAEKLSRSRPKLKIEKDSKKYNRSNFRKTTLSKVSSQSSPLFLKIIAIRDQND